MDDVVVYARFDVHATDCFPDEENGRRLARSRILQIKGLVETESLRFKVHLDLIKLVKFETLHTMPSKS
jgi:hypothetical protein